MTTKEVADQLVAYCREGKYDEAYDMYADDAVSAEMPGMPNAVTQGKQQIIKEYQEWASSIEEMHGGSVGDPVVAGNHFMVPMTMDATFKEQGRVTMDELCVYEVADDKIKKATFFYEVPEMG